MKDSIKPASRRTRKNRRGHSPNQRSISSHPMKLRSQPSAIPCGSQSPSFSPPLLHGQSQGVTSQVEICALPDSGDRTKSITDSATFDGDGPPPQNMPTSSLNFSNALQVMLLPPGQASPEPTEHVIASTAEQMLLDYELYSATISPSTSGTEYLYWDDEQNCIDTQLLLLWAEAHLLDDSVNSDAFANDLFGSPIQLD